MTDPTQAERVVVYEDASGEWRWKALAGNNKVIADSGEGYKKKKWAWRMAEFLFPKAKLEWGDEKEEDVPQTWDERWEEVGPGEYARTGGTSEAPAKYDNDGVNATQGAIDLAAERGIDLADVEGSGAEGRVTKADVEAFVADE